MHIYTYTKERIASSLSPKMGNEIPIQYGMENKVGNTCMSVCHMSDRCTELFTLWRNDLPAGGDRQVHRLSTRDRKSHVRYRILVMTQLNMFNTFERTKYADYISTIYNVRHCNS